MSKAQDLHGWRYASMHLATFPRRIEAGWKSMGSGALGVQHLLGVIDCANCDMQELRKPVPEEHELSSAGPPEVLFHSSMQYDHTIKRWEHEWAGSQACGSHDVTAPLQVEVRPDSALQPPRRRHVLLLGQPWKAHLECLLLLLARHALVMVVKVLLCRGRL